MKVNKNNTSISNAPKSQGNWNLAAQVIKLFIHMLCLNKISGILLKETVSCEGRSGRSSMISHWKGWEGAVSHHAVPCQSCGFGLSVRQSSTEEREKCLTPFSTDHTGWLQSGVNRFQLNSHPRLLMMKRCRSFKTKTPKIKGFSGHHDKQGCIQSPVHKNKKYE